ncbi:hypothetical protein [Lacisediminihabitans profunda]|uniref:Uncharacterized protein n=1 Tax=Lacisediminihabitans profunda TaxID=2594790 RepID=A0A5C8URY5_9MICO|nr:hypothetical protein [Lacisediminihabitans profunda]TXN31285.1 hypothetical protein FVP33_06875 [Lacisediminihabitans profunda]
MALDGVFRGVAGARDAVARGAAGFLAVAGRRGAAGLRAELGVGFSAVAASAVSAAPATTVSGESGITGASTAGAASAGAGSAGAGFVGAARGALAALVERALGRRAGRDAGVGLAVCWSVVDSAGVDSASVWADSTDDPCVGRAAPAAGR